MAYNTDYRQRPPANWNREDHAGLSNGTDLHGYPLKGRASDHPQLEPSRPTQTPYQRNDFSPQDEYSGYRQNPWSAEPVGYNAQAHTAKPRAYNWDDPVDGDYFPQQEQKTSRPQYEEQRLPRGPGRPTPRHQRPEEPTYNQRSDSAQARAQHNDHNPYGWHQEEHDMQSAYGRYNGDGVETRNNSSQHPALPFRDRTHDSNARRDNGDQLPRYMNGHAHRFSQDNHHRNAPLQAGPYPTNHDSSMPSDVLQPFDPRDRSDQQAPMKHIPRRNESGNDSRSWDNPFPTFPASSKHRPQEQTSTGYTSQAASGLHQESDWSKRKPANSQEQQLHNFHEPYDAHNKLSNSQADNISSARNDPRYPRPLSFERSRTMPAALSDPAPESGLIPADDHSKWQEPGAVSGYYGSQGDTAPERVPDQSGGFRPQALPRSQSDDPQWGNNHAAKPVQTQDSRQNRFPTESRGEILNAHPEHDFPSNLPSQNRQFDDRRPQPHDTNMPNFDTVPHQKSYGRDMTLEDHLRPQGRRPDREAQRNYPMDLGRHEQHLGHPGVEDMPRSRSQPDFSGRPPRAGQQNEGYEPPLGPYERPATSASARDYGQHPNRGGFGPQDGPRGPSGPGTSSRGPWGPPGSSQGFGPRNKYGAPGTHPNGFRREGPPVQRPAPGQHVRPSHDRMQPPGLGRRPDERAAHADQHRSPPPQIGRAPPDPRAPPSLYQQNRSPSAQGVRENPERGPQPGSGAQNGRQKHRMPSLDKPLPNPDALPSHPAPVRPGLSNGQQSGSNTRPTPVRQYNSGSSDPLHQPASANGRSGPGAVTYQDLEALKQQTHRHPNDNAAQFLLAQKLVEAADVLVDERADASTKKRNRDKYQSDALKIIKKLSALSYGEADFFYADCYSRGVLGLQPDIREAFLLYQKAAKANHAQAAYRVAVCCELGQEDGGGTKRDPVKAMQWYRRAATLGDTAAMYKMGVILLKGLLGQPRDPSEGITWLKQAAERADRENPHALHELALLHEKPTGLESIRHDEGQSRRLFTQAANLGYKFSQFRLGCAYEYGLLGCAVDPRQSIAWYSKAAVQEEHQSELALSGWYLTGSDGILQQSDTEAYLWARKAAQAGMAKAEYAMGYFTEVGIGAPANLEDAKRWYWKSASQNFPKARDRLEDLRRGGGPKQKTRVSRSNMRKQSDGECIIM